MSGPTGTRGGQGIKGDQGGTGPTGIQGQYGGAGPVGPQGGVGLTGITGGTGTQLYGNASLVQSSQCILLGPTGGILFGISNPLLVSGKSTTISGQYDSTQLNYYGTPLSTLDGYHITIPAGKYYITATMSTNMAVAVGTIIYLSLSTYDGSTYTDIAWSTPASRNGLCYLQHIYTTTVDTVVSIRKSVETADITSGNPCVNLSIVKIW